MIRKQLEKEGKQVPCMSRNSHIWVQTRCPLHQYSLGNGFEHNLLNQEFQSSRYCLWNILWLFGVNCIICWIVLAPWCLLCWWSGLTCHLCGSLSCLLSSAASLSHLGLGLIMKEEILVICPVQMSVLSLVNLPLIPSRLRVACTEVGRKNILLSKKGELAKPLCILNQGCK